MILAQPEKDDDHSLTGITRKALNSADGREVSVDDMMNAFGAASFVPLLILPALMVISPLGGVPGLSSLFGVMIVLIAGQRVLGRHNIWLPGFLRHRSVGSDKAENAMKKIGMKSKQH